MNLITRLKRIKTLEDGLAQSDNSFNLIRLLASAAVIFGHSWALANNPTGETDWLGQKTGLFTGTLAVMVFFFISGLLVSKSWIQRPQVIPFVLARGLRIFPALVVCVSVCVLLMGPALTTESMQQYWASDQTWRYWWGSASLWNLQWNLPGVFEQHRHQAINGSLWTLPGEVRMYAWVLMFGVLGLLDRAWRYWIAAIFVCWIGYQAWPQVQLVQQVEYGELALCFVLGVGGYLFRKYLPLHGALVVAIAVLAWWMNGSAWKTPTLVLAALYLVLWAGLLRDRIGFNRIGDYSYGLYLYGYPSQQLVAHWFPAWGPWQSMLLSLPLALFAAVLSWHWIEKHALRWKHWPVQAWLEQILASGKKLMVGDRGGAHV